MKEEPSKKETRKEHPKAEAERRKIRKRKDSEKARVAEKERNPHGKATKTNEWRKSGLSETVSKK